MTAQTLTDHVPQTHARLHLVVAALEDAASVAFGGKGEFGYGETPGYVEKFSEADLEARAEAHGDRLIHQADGSHLVEEVAPDMAPNEVHEIPAMAA